MLGRGLNYLHNIYTNKTHQIINNIITGPRIHRFLIIVGEIWRESYILFFRRLTLVKIRENPLGPIITLPIESKQFLISVSEMFDVHRVKTNYRYYSRVNDFFCDAHTRKKKCIACQESFWWRSTYFLVRTAFGWVVLINHCHIFLRAIENLTYVYYRTLLFLSTYLYYYSNNYHRN